MPAFSCLGASGRSPGTSEEAVAEAEGFTQLPMAAGASDGAGAGAGDYSFAPCFCSGPAMGGAQPFLNDGGRSNASRVVPDSQSILGTYASH
jgi:hypothetical protein